MKARKRDYAKMLEKIDYEILPLEIKNERFIFFNEEYDYIVGKIIRTHIHTKNPFYDFQMMLIPEVVLYFYVNDRVWNLYMSFPVYKKNLQKYYKKIEKRNLDISMIPTMITVDSSLDLGMGCVNEFNFYDLGYGNIEKQIADIMAKKNH